MLIKQDDEPDYLYFIAEGKCEVIVNDFFGNSETNDQILIKGNYFGEVAILHNTKRTATVKSINYCTFGLLEKNIFDLISVDLKNEIKARTIDYKDKMKLFKMKFLEYVDYFEF